MIVSPVPVRRAVTGALLLAVLPLLACGGDGGPGGGSGAADLVAAPAEQWAWLSVPSGGGRAVLRPLAAPGDSLWTSRTSLPAAREVGRLGDRYPVLRDAEGEVYRFDLSRDRLDRLGSVGAEARWAASGEYGLWFGGGEGRSLWLVSPAGTRRHTTPRPVTWARPTAEGGIVALLGQGRDATLVRYPPGAPGEEGPSASAELPLSPPGVLTAWGRLAVLTSASGEEPGLRLVRLPQLEAAGRASLPGPVSAVAGSGSSHELYAAVRKPPRVLFLDRFSLEVLRRVDFERPVTELRAGVLGGELLARTAGGTYLIPWGGGDPVPVRTEWREDLPVTLPDGAVLALRDGKVLRVRPGEGGGGEPRPVGSAAGAWVPVRWRPRPEGEERPARGTGDTLSTAEGAAGDTAGAGGAGALPDTAAGPDPLAVAGPDTLAVAGDDTLGGMGRDTARGRSSPPQPGFYAVVEWARSVDAARKAVRPLVREGYPTAVQARADDADRTWYRGLVGPYAERSEAERIARRLRRERGLEAWVEEVRPDLLPDDVLR